VDNELGRIRRAAKRDRRQKFTALFHHIYDIGRLERAYGELNPEAAKGGDGVTWKAYGKDLEGNLADLSGRLKRGAYRAKPVRRVYISKEDGRQRPLGVPALEDKIVQRAAVEVLNTVYETNFLGFSYGFRPGRSQHQALDALWMGIRTRTVAWVLDADIRSFFDTLKHEWLVKFIEHRIADRRVVRLVQKWLKAGVLEDGERIRSEDGAVQGGCISPLLANIYLHYVFDLWAQAWRKTQAHGDVVVVRFADDFIAGFQQRQDAERFLEELKRRFAKFGLELHPEKTRLIEFGRYAAQNRRKRGEGKPETFDSLGLTHICGRSRKGWFTVVRHTKRKKRQAKLKELATELRHRMHLPIPVQGAYLRSVLSGHYRYYGVPGNSRNIAAFRYEVTKLWRKTLSRRSQTAAVSWDRMNRLVARWLPPARLCHPYPDARFGVTT